MDARLITAAEPLIQQYYAQAEQSVENKRNKVIELFNTRKVPDEGWSDADVEALLHNIALMDSNNFSDCCGVGERESRFASNIVARRHYRMGHGIGRSGDIAELQPKAAGSSLINKIANELVLDVLKLCGIPSTKKCLILPMATGMSLMLCMRTFHSQRPGAKYVVWSRIDQKSCFKSIITAGLIPVVIDCCVCQGQLITNTKAIYEAVTNLGAQHIVCIITTTSSFAPRAPDSLEVVARICDEYDVPHLVNNAYGLQCSTHTHLIEKAIKTRVDAYVLSTDKNFMVPVGGAVVASYSEEIINAIAKMYPGRGSCNPSMDVLITLLNLGRQGLKSILHSRNDVYRYLKGEMKKIAEEYGETLLIANNNEISVGMTLKKFSVGALITEIGSMMFSKFVSGMRVVPTGETKDISGFKFVNWGSHSSDYNCNYLTASATVGITRADVDMFIKRLDEVLLKAQKTAVQITTSTLLSS